MIFILGYFIAGMLFGIIVFPLANMITSFLSICFETLQTKLSVIIAKDGATIQEIRENRQPTTILGFTDDGGPE